MTEKVKNHSRIFCMLCFLTICDRACKKNSHRTFFELGKLTEKVLLGSAGMAMVDMK